MIEMKQRQYTILFVDDEPSILASLRRAFRKEGWHMLTAQSGAEGLELLRQQPVHVVVSDMLMAEMDGAEFLKRVKAMYPGTVRIVLTGFPKSEVATRAFAEADIHELVPKPWQAAELKVIINSALAQTADQEESSSGLPRLLDEMGTLPSLPNLYTEVRQAMEDADEISVDRVAEVIMRDPAVSAKILQVANSSYFGRSRQVETVKKAIVLLGLESVANLVLSVSVFESFKDRPIDGFGRDEFWEHSAAVSAAAKALATARGRSRDYIAVITLAGILHDLGKLVFASSMNERYARAIAQAVKDGRSIAAVEKEMLGVSHTAVGGHLGDWWNLPTPVVEAMRFHHEPASSAKSPEFASTIHIADALAHELNMGASGTGQIPEIDSSALETLGLDEADLDGIRAQLAELADS